MTGLRKNIERYKQQKGIKKDSDLLRNIARELGVEKGRIYLSLIHI